MTSKQRSHYQRDGFFVIDRFVAESACDAHKAPALTLSGDYLGDVDRIAAAAAGAAREDEYFKSLDWTFCIDAHWRAFF